MASSIHECHPSRGSVGIWRFPKIGVLPVIIHFLLVCSCIFHEINHPAMGVPRQELEGEDCSGPAWHPEQKPTNALGPSWSNMSAVELPELPENRVSIYIYSLNNHQQSPSIIYHDFPCRYVPVTEDPTVIKKHTFDRTSHRYWNAGDLGSTTMAHSLRGYTLPRYPKENSPRNGRHQLGSCLYIPNHRYCWG